MSSETSFALSPKQWVARKNAMRIKSRRGKKAEMDAKKNAIRAEDMTKGVFVPVSTLPKQEPRKAPRKENQAV